MNEFGLSENIINIILEYFRTIPNIESVRVYGSRALGTYRKGSDIDFAIFGKNIDDNLITKIKYEIDELKTPYMFDITDYNSIGNPKLKEHIDKQGKIFYKK